MNIVMFSADYFPPEKMNANHNRLLYLAKGLKKHHNVIIFCPNNKPKYEEVIYENIKIIRFPYYNRISFGKFFMVLSAHKYLKKILEKENINMNILWYNSSLGFMLSKKFDCLKIYDVMGIVSNELISDKKIYSYLKSFLHRIMEKILYKNSSVIITINKAHKIILSKKFHKNIYIIRDAVQYNKGINQPAYDKVVKQYEDNFILFFVGSFIRKRFDKNIDAIESLIKKIPEIRIIIAGDGKYLDYYKNIFIKKRIIKNFEFIGHISGKDLNSYIKASDVCFSDVFLEGFPYKIYEYMAMGKVSLVENTKGVKEILIDGKNSLLYKNSKEFENKVLKIMNNPKLKKRIEKNALIESKKHTWYQREREFNKIIGEISR